MTLSRPRPAAVFWIAAALSGVAAVLLVPANVAYGKAWWSDPESPGQLLAAYLTTAVHARTSGTALGLVCATAAALVAARGDPRPTAVRTAAAGVGLGLAVLVPAAARATPELRDLAGGLSHTPAAPDVSIAAWPVGHGVVLLAMAASLALFPLAALLGHAAARARPDWPRYLVTPAVLLAAPVVRYLLMYGMMRLGGGG